MRSSLASIFKRHVVCGAETEPPEPSVSELFHENTKLHPDVAIGSFIPGSYSHVENQAMAQLGRRYHRAAQVSLPPVADLPPLERTLESSIIERRTRRHFSDKPLSTTTLSKLLFLTGGITAKQQTESGFVRLLRAAPSGGALYPIEVYLAVRRVEGIASGVYHYAAKEHVLELLREGDPSEELLRACHYHESLQQAALVFVFSAVLERTKRKYGERGYRLVLLEAGHVAQNLCLASTALNLGCMNICGFFDDRLNQLLFIDGLEEAALYAAYVGSIPPKVSE